MPVGDGNVIGNDHKLGGYHHKGQKYGEGNVLALKIKPCKGKSRKYRNHHHYGRGKKCKNNGIEEISRKINRRKSVKIILHRRMGGYEFGNILRKKQE